MDTQILHGEPYHAHGTSKSLINNDERLRPSFAMVPSSETSPLLLSGSKLIKIDKYRDSVADRRSDPYSTLEQ